MTTLPSHTLNRSPRRRRSHGQDMTLPPSLELLFSELNPDVVFDADAFACRFYDRGFLRDLQAQAKYSLAKYDYSSCVASSSDRAFSFLGAGGLDPTSSEAKCNTLPRRRANA